MCTCTACCSTKRMMYRKHVYGLIKSILNSKSFNKSNKATKKTYRPGHKHFKHLYYALIDATSQECAIIKTTNRIRVKCTHRAGVPRSHQVQSFPPGTVEWLTVKLAISGRLKQRQSHTHETASLLCEQKSSQFQTECMHVRRCVCSCALAAVPWPLGNKTRTPTLNTVVSHILFPTHAYSDCLKHALVSVWQTRQRRVIIRHGGRNWL